MFLMENRDVYKVLLWVYIVFCSYYDLFNNVFEIFLYRLVLLGKYGGFFVKRFFKKRKRLIFSISGWYYFDVLDIVYCWVLNFFLNFGLVVEVFDVENENLIVMLFILGIDEGYVSNF